MFTCGSGMFNSGGDPYWANVTSLLYFNGMNGSTTFTDEVLGNTWSAVGGASISTVQSKFGNSSLYLGSSGSAIKISDNSKFNFGASNFTIEVFGYLVTANAFGQFFIKRSSSSGTTPFSLGSTNAGNVPIFYSSQDGSSWTVGITASTTLPSTTWVHLAVVRNGNTCTLYLNGVSVGSGTYTGAVMPTTAFGSIGGNNDGSQTFLGYLDSFRVTQGVARYISNFVPPTSQFPNY